MSLRLEEAAYLAAGTTTGGDRNILQAIVYQPAHAASARDLRTLLGLKSHVQANAAIGRLGRKIHRRLGAAADARRTSQWWQVAATGRHDPAAGFVWTLRKGVVKGLARAGYSLVGAPLPEEIREAVLTEGASRRILVNAYERNPVARARCIAAHGHRCVVCHFDFGSTYGPSAEGYIHVHHLLPLSRIGKEYEVDPVKDLVPVCPNCHAVIHMTSPPASIGEIKSMIGRGRVHARSGVAR